MPAFGSSSFYTTIRSSFARGAGTVFLSQVLGAGLSYLVQVSFARWAGPSAYGIYSYALAWTSILALLSGIGLPHASLRFIPEYVALRDWSRLRGIAQGSEWVVLGIGCGCSLLGTIFLTYRYGLTTATNEIAAIILGLWIGPLLALAKLRSEKCRAVNQMIAAYGAPRVLRPLLMIVGGAFWVYLFGSSLTSTVAILLAGASLVPVVILQRQAFRQHVASPFHQATPTYNFRTWMAVALPLLLTAASLAFLQYTDLLMIGLFIGAEEVGIYKAAAKTAGATAFVLTAINAVAAPRFAALHTTPQTEARLQNFVLTIAHWIFWPSLGSTFLLIALSAPLLSLFGPAFVEGQNILIILALGHLANASGGSVGYLLNMTGHHTACARVYGIAALINVGLNAGGLYLLGLPGAAVATALCVILWNVWLYRIVVDMLNVRPSIFDAWRSSG